MTTDPLQIYRYNQPINLANLWAPYPGFLVCGGPSINDFPLQRLKDRGIVSLAVNQVASYVPVRAWCFSDSHYKFHYGMWIDPAIMTFAPVPKISGRRRFHMQVNGEFCNSAKTSICPNTFGFQRRTCFVPATFFETDYAHWGPGYHQPKDVPPIGCLCTMLIGIRLLHYLGVKRIYLLGVDWVGRDGKCYGFPDTKRERNRRYKRENAMLEALLPRFKEKGIEIFNCNLHSRCLLFDYISFDDALDDCKGDVPDEPFDATDWYRMNWHEEQCARNPSIIPRHFDKI